MSEIRLLLVDDEDFFRENVGKELALTGYAVESAGSLEEARRLLKQHSFHVAVLDLRLPDGSGLDLLGEIKEQSPLTEVVVLTAYGTIEERAGDQAGRARLPHQAVQARHARGGINETVSQPIITKQDKPPRIMRKSTIFKGKKIG